MLSMTKHVYSPGTVDYEGRGTRNLVEIEWEVRDGEFSMSGAIWDARHYDELSGGQNIDKIAALFPDDVKVQRMHAIWERWHLNKRRAGSPAQERWLRENPIPPEEYAYPKSHYEVARHKLAEAGLNPDTSFTPRVPNVNTEGGYRYRSAWIREELPADVLAEIESWD